MAKSDGGPAFPEPERWAGKEHGPYTEDHGYRHKGMSLRDYFAGQALALCYHEDVQFQTVADDAYRLADAMLARREE